MKHFSIFNDIVSACDDKAQKLSRYMAAIGDNSPLILCFKPTSNGENGELLMIQDGMNLPDGFVSTGEKLLCNVEYSRYWVWIRERSMRLPILA